MKHRPILNYCYHFCFVQFVHSLIVFLCAVALFGCVRLRAPQPHAALPDLVLVPDQRGGFNRTKGDKGGISVLITVKNQGLVDAPSSTTGVRFYTIDDRSWPVEVPTFGLSAGASVTVETLVPPACRPYCYFEIEANSKHQVDESDRNNNKASGVLVCTGGPCQ